MKYKIISSIAVITFSLSGFAARGPVLKIKKDWHEQKPPLPAILRQFAVKATDHSAEVSITKYKAPDPKSSAEFQRFVASQFDTKSKYKIGQVVNFKCHSENCYSAITRISGLDGQRVSGLAAFRQKDVPYLAMFSLPNGGKSDIEFAQKIMNELQGSL